MKRGRTGIKSSRTDRRQAVVCVAWIQGKKMLQTVRLILILLVMTGCRENGQAVQIGDGRTQAFEEQEDGRREGGTETFTGTQGSGGKSPEAAGTAEGTTEKAPPSAPPVFAGGAEETDVGIWVHVCGQVRFPGVYELEQGSRVWDAVQAAGGLTQEADEESVNLALIVADGSKVTIPSKSGPENGEAQEGAVFGGGQQMEGGGEEWYEAPPQTRESDSGREIAAGLVDINRAGEAELVTIPGIGQTRAQAILSYREEHGPFAAIEDIMQVTGIKEGLFAKIRDYITVGG